MRPRGDQKKYVGHIRDDTWKRRLEAGFEDDFGPDVVRQPFKRARQSTTAVLEICDELGLDFNDSKHRIKAHEPGKTRLRDEWITRSQNSELDDTVSDDIGGSSETKSLLILKHRMSRRRRRIGKWMVWTRRMIWCTSKALLLIEEVRGTV
jgi:hypothetical protein